MSVETDSKILILMRKKMYVIKLDFPHLYGIQFLSCLPRLSKLEQNGFFSLLVLEFGNVNPVFSTPVDFMGLDRDLAYVPT